MNTEYIKIWRYVLFAIWMVCVASSAGGEVRAIVERVQVEGAGVCQCARCAGVVGYAGGGCGGFGVVAKGCSADFAGVSGAWILACGGCFSQS